MSNSKDPFDMSNTESPFYNPKQYVDQTTPGGFLGAVYGVVMCLAGLVLTIWFFGNLFMNIVYPLLPSYSGLWIAGAMILFGAIGKLMGKG
jgi:hypothetical protein